MKISSTPLLVALFLVTALHSRGQGVIGGSQNGLGPGGYLPVPAPIREARVVTSLTTAGYDFQIVSISGQPTRVVVDAAPVIVPLVKTGATSSTLAPNSVGFWATFVLANNSSIDRTFTFVDQYYANVKIAFRVLDSDDQVVWQSYQTEVDIPPLAKHVNLILGRHAAWRKSVFVPFQKSDLALLDPGQYTLEAQIIGTPGYLARAPFNVSILVGGPIVPLTPAKN